MKQYTSVQNFLEELGIDKEEYKTIYEPKKEPEIEIPVIPEEPRDPNEKIYSSLHEFFEEILLEIEEE